MLNIFNLILKTLIGESASGSLTVSSSVPEIDIHTGWHPRYVFISFDDCHANVCGAGQDWFDVKKTHHGFIIFCNVKSNSRKITWLAIG